MGNKYMKPDQSIKDLCDKNYNAGHLRHNKRSSKSIDDIPTRIYLDKSHRFRFLTRSFRKKTHRPVRSRPQTIDRECRESSLFSGEQNIDEQNLGFAIFKDESFELAKMKYCHKICTSTPKFRRFNALEEFEKMYKMNLNGYGSDVSSISRSSLFSLDENHRYGGAASNNVTGVRTKYIKKPKPLHQSLLRLFEEERPSGNIAGSRLVVSHERDVDEHRRKTSCDTRMLSGSSLLNIVKPQPKQINVIIIGDKGVGKTTLIHSLLQSNEDNIAAPSSISPISIYKAAVTRSHRKLNVTIVDTPGLDIDTQGKSGRSIVEDFVEKCMGTENRTLHCCLYCISPFHESLRSFDIALMKRLESLVNIVPVIVKVDYLSVMEMQSLKRSIRESLKNNHVKIYQMPRCAETLTREHMLVNENIKRILPFAIIGSRHLLTTNDGIIRGRKYPWGIINIDNPMHCDMFWLRKFLFDSHCADLVSTTRLQLVRRTEARTGKTCTM